MRHFIFEGKVNEAYSNVMNNPQYTKLAFKHFGLTFPISDSGLKKAYRRESLKLHPDQGGDAEEFKKMSMAYGLLSEAIGRVPGVSKSDVVLDITKTVEGFSLSELGLGLGPTVNGKDCTSCDHKGYQARWGGGYSVCINCGHDGCVYADTVCRDCKGSGKFQQRKSLRIVTCLRCKGLGVFKSLDRRLCPICFGTKTIWNKSEKKHYVKCSICNGTGELKVFNPVIIKGALL